MAIYIAFYNKMYPNVLYIFLLISVFLLISSKETEEFSTTHEVLPGFGEYNGTMWKSYSTNHPWGHLVDIDYNFTFPLRLPHWVGDRLRLNRLVIRTFPTEINYFKENTEYTKKISLEMETSCGSSKSAFDETDIVLLTLMEKQNDRSVFVKTIKIDPLSVDFYSPKLSMKQFKMLAEDEIKGRAKYCDELCKKNNGSAFESRYLSICPNYTCTCNEKIEDAEQSYAEMEKFVKIMKYLQIFQSKSPNCYLGKRIFWPGSKPQTIVELDNKTASSFPKFNDDHYFVASFVDTKNRKSAAIILNDYKII